MTAGHLPVSASGFPAEALRAAFVLAFSDYLAGPPTLTLAQWPTFLGRHGIDLEASRVVSRGDEVLAFALVTPRPALSTWRLAAMGAVLQTRGKLGFNAKWLIEMGEETGSSGLRELCTEHRDLFAADVLIGSDGPRISIDRPTVYLGSRGGFPIDLWIEARQFALSPDDPKKVIEVFPENPHIWKMERKDRGR